MTAVGLVRGHGVEHGRVGGGDGEGDAVVGDPGRDQDNEVAPIFRVRIEGEELAHDREAAEQRDPAARLGHLGDGEAGDADFGIAGGRDVGFVYAHGRVLKKVSSDILVDELFHEIDKWIAEGMHRPKRLKMAKPAALAMAEASMIPLE